MANVHGTRGAIAYEAKSLERLKFEGWNPEPDVVLRSNASLRRYVERELL